MSIIKNGTTGDEVVQALAAEARGKTILITGPSESGIGASTVISLAAGKPKTILLAGRNLSKISPVISRIAKEHPDVQVYFVQLDLASQKSVRETATTVNSQITKLDILINNAGVMAIKDFTKTVDGIEVQFGTNHIGHFLLTNLLMDKLLAAGKGARIINVSSFGYLSGGARFDDWNFKNGAEYQLWLAYAQSKTANILMANYLAEKLKNKGILAFSLSPGLIPSSKLSANLTPDLLALGRSTVIAALKGEEIPLAAITPMSLEQAAGTVLFAALDPHLASHSGAFIVDCSVWEEELRGHARGEENARQLWELSERLVGEKFTY